MQKGSKIVEHMVSRGTPVGSWLAYYPVEFFSHKDDGPVGVVFVYDDAKQWMREAAAVMAREKKAKYVDQTCGEINVENGFPLCYLDVCKQ